VFQAAFPHGLPARLGGADRLGVVVREFFRLVEQAETQARFAACITRYYYTLSDSENREILSYHWHPDQPGMVAYPHLHLGPGAQLGWRKLAGAHLPTGQVRLEDLLRLAIGELGVQPRRKDWKEVLRTTQ